MPYDKSKYPRMLNQYPILENPWDLTEGAKKLLEILLQYEHRQFISTRQLGFLLMIPQRKVRKYISELVLKKRIKVTPENRKSQGPKATNKYEVIKDFKPEDYEWD